MRLTRQGVRSKASSSFGFLRLSKLSYKKKKRLLYNKILKPLDCFAALPPASHFFPSLRLSPPLARTVTMLPFRRIQIILMVVIAVGMTGFLYRWHSVHDPSQWLSPTMYDKDDNKDLLLKRQLIDQKYCGGPCRFILPVFIMEQGKHGLGWKGGRQVKE